MKGSKSTGLAKNSIIVFGLTTFGSVLNYLCQILMGRFLSVSNYGFINTVFSLTLLFSVIGSTGSMILSKTISEGKVNISYKLLKLINILFLIFTLLIFVCYPYFFSKIDFILYILAALCITSSIYPIVFQGLYGGLGKFLPLGLYTLIVPIIKIIAIIFLLLFKTKYSLNLVLISIILGNVLSIIVGYIVLYKNINKLNQDDLKKNIYEYSTIFFTNIFLMFLMNIDVLFLSVFYNKTTTGYYSSVLVFGKMIYYFVTALVTVLLPIISKNNTNKNYVKNLLFRSLLLTFILSVICLIPINLFGKTFLNILFGTKYDNAVQYIKYASLISLSYSLNMIILNYLVGINKAKFMQKLLTYGTIILVILLGILNNHLKLCLLWISLINFAIFIISIIYIKKNESSVSMEKIQINNEYKEKISVVVPCYNEEKNVYKNLLKISKIISSFSNNYEIIAVNDGSKDNTESEIEKAVKKDKNIYIETYKKNQGKGYALKYGTKKTTGEIVVFIDSDLELSPLYIQKYIDIIHDKNCDSVIASKMHKESIIKYPFRRRVLSLGYYCMLKVLFNLNNKDTQTGLKIFKGDLIRTIMSLIETNGFSFDIEVLALINRYGYKIEDAPIELNFTREHAMGRISINDITKMIIDTFKIFFKLRFQKYYDKKIKEKTKNNKNLFFFIGTEAELMKMYHVIQEADKREYKTFIVSNAQNDISHSKYLNIINKKIDIDLTKYAPKKKGMKEYVKWFVKTRAYGIKKFKKIRKMYDFKNSLMVVHGDTMSTLMGSMISRKVKLRYAHVESGPRSFNWFSPFPEEIDRYFSSKKSVLNFCQSAEATECAKKFFKAPAINTHFNTGIEILFDALDECKAKKLKSPLKEKYFVFAIHRQENLLNKDFMQNTVEEVCKISKKIKCLFIYHDQTKETLKKFKLWNKIKNNKNFEIVGRQEYVDFINIIKHSEFVIGDGCGNQQEFYYMGKPYLIMRTEVEEKTEGLGWNAKPFESDFSNIAKFYEEYVNYKHDTIEMKEKPSQIIINEIDRWYKNEEKNK